MATSNELPDFDSIMQRQARREPLNPLEEFIFENEPADPHLAAEFRKELSALIAFVSSSPCDLPANQSSQSSSDSGVSK